MSPASPLPARRRLRPALSLVEVLVGLAIGAILFTALATAIQAGIRNEQANADYSAAMQTARVALNNLTNAIRTAYDVDLESMTVASGSTASGKNLLVLPTATAPAIAAYRWDGVGKQLLFYPDKTVTTVSDTTPKLAKKLEDVTFTALYVTDPANPANLMVKQLTVAMIVHTGGNRITISASASPRRAVTVY